MLTYFGNQYLIRPHFEFPALMPTLLGTALSFFIGFNNNQAYGRWWEARIIWGGLVNESRTWARLCLTFVGEGEASRAMVRRHLAFVYALRDFLRGNTTEGAGTHLVWSDYLDADEARATASRQNRHNALLLRQGTELQALYAQQRIDGFQLLELQRCLSNLTNEMGRAERIKGTVFPTTYHHYTHLFVFLLIVSVTAVLGNNIGPWAILFGWLIGYVFLSIQAIGAALLEPFDAIPTGVALDQISRNIERNLLEMLGEEALPPPVASINGEYVL